MTTPVATQLITRAKLAAGYRISVSYGGPLAGAYAHARHAPPKGVILDKQADIQAQCDHDCGLYSKLRLIGDVPVKPGPYYMGQVVTFKYPRYGFEAGKQLLVRNIRKDITGKTLILTLWG